MTEKEQLIPCPFCGKETVDIEESNVRNGNSVSYRVSHYCDQLDQLIIFKEVGYHEAIKVWNTRAISADEKEQLIRLKAFVNDILYDDGDYITEYPRSDAIKHGIIVAVNGCVSKADWMKDGDN